jgi:hypothetical protein
MGRATIIVSNDNDRLLAASWAQKSPDGTRIEFKRSKRTTPQNDLMWARLTEISRQVEWYGQMLTNDDWKEMFTASLKKQRVVPGLDAGTFVVLGASTSDMTKEEMGNLLDFMDAFAAERGVVFQDNQESAA